MASSRTVPLVLYIKGKIKCSALNEKNGHQKSCEEKGGALLKPADFSGPCVTCCLPERFSVCPHVLVPV